MKKKIVLVSVIMLIVATFGYSQWRNACTARGTGNRANPLHTFDTAAPVIIDGKIVKVEKATTGKGRYGGGIHLTVAEGKKETEVRLGPAGYLEANGWEFKKGDKIKVNAFKGTGESKNFLFAAGISIGEKSLTLRNKDGMPTWRRSANNRGFGKGRRNARRGCCSTPRGRGFRGCR